MPETQNKEKIVKAPREESQMSSKGLSTRVALGSSNTRKEQGDAFKTLRENYVPRELYVQPNIKHEGKIKIQSDTKVSKSPGHPVSESSGKRCSTEMRK